jgi:nucleotide-binding universal stress UspA family protein
MRSIIVGVDSSPESIRAAAFGITVAERTRAALHFVHAVPPYWTTLPPELGLQVADLDKAALESARTLVCNSLQGTVPDRMLDSLEVAIGRAPMVLAEAAERHTADVVILGAKHHRALARLGGSSITHLVRSGTVPILATDGLRPARIERVLAAVDLSQAATVAIEHAERWAAAFGARLRVLHTVEPMPVVPGITLQVADDEVFRSTERLVDTEIAPLVSHPGAEIVVRRGRSASAIVSEAEQWNADLVVVGSHGRGWVSRLLIGSTSERLLQIMPAAVLVVPAPQHAPLAHALPIEMPWSVAPPAV